MCMCGSFGRRSGMSLLRRLRGLGIVLNRIEFLEGRGF
jgi:hypothetical protein